MQDALHTLKSIEKSSSLLMERYDTLRESHKALQLELDSTKSKLAMQQLDLEECQHKFQSLKHANTLLGSDNDKRDTKLKINTLIREIDTCIAQLSQ